MNGAIRAIPTTYKGRAYRSRLEARWAAFFELLGWQYEYEPYDLNGWIPDFLIVGKETWSSECGKAKPSHLKSTEILVEVKPYVNLEQFDLSKIIHAAPPEEGREILLLGSTIFLEGDWGSPAIGWLGDCWWSGPEEVDYSFSWAQFTSHDRIGFCHGLNSYHDRITGEYCGGHVLAPTWEQVLALWNRAGNMVQWKPIKKADYAGGAGSAAQSATPSPGGTS